MLPGNGVIVSKKQSNIKKCQRGYVDSRSAMAKALAALRAPMLQTRGHVSGGVKPPVRRG